jgi:ribosome modulation factor
MDLQMRKKAKRKPLSRPKSRKVESGSKGKSKPKTPSDAKDKEELIRIWDADLCE